MPYVGQHGDDQAALGGAVRRLAGPTGAPTLPCRSRPPSAEPLAEGPSDSVTRVLAERAAAVAVAVVDRRGEAGPRGRGRRRRPPARRTSPRRVAAAAALFGLPSADAADLVAATRHVLPVPVAGAGRRRPAARRQVGPRRRRRPTPSACAELAAAVWPSHDARVCVVGCGAIGSLYAAHLARLDDVEVWAIDPWADHVAAINEHGLRVTGRDSFVAPVRARTPRPTYRRAPRHRRHQGRAHPRGRGGVRRRLRRRSVASVQNGLGNEEVLAELVPRVIRGTILPAGAVTAPGVVRYDAPGDTWLGPVRAQAGVARTR